MTRAEILATYKVDERGIIRDPGKFEGEMLYAPYFYAQMMDGEGEDVYIEDYEQVEDPSLLYTLLAVTDADRAEFPEIGPTTTHVRLFESTSGFIFIEEV